ncbi:helix-turn-helix domain-containing protein [Sessilibacter corallicola]|uniref:AraC family transcriptional regulator n=1 Tax=Sessilibacter corallicola TaxID=2904075 RepID=A0ABQ0A6V6_9GAMM
MTKKLHFSNLHDYHEYLGIAAPEHPMFSVINMQSDTSDEITCTTDDIEMSTDFYSISIKHILSGDIYYGRTQYDFRNGSLICFGPRQAIRTKGVRAKTHGRSIVIHEDFLRGISIQKSMREANYFSYAVNEALHLSPKEEALITGIVDTLEQEYLQNHDAFSKDIMVSQLNTLLTYAERFYQRQFRQRKESQTTSLETRFYNTLQAAALEHMPSVEEIANQLNMTSRYLSDALKLETGHTTLENIHIYQIDRAKNLLLGSEDSVATIAYALGFEYPQYFSRLFKNKVGMTPTEYRETTKH